jgi:DNA invertase Pin-like site-specific DNA recombinase
MSPDLLIPVAQYLRMSTEHQQYSLDNQRTAIQAYAEGHRFQVVQTYTDGAKTLAGRDGRQTGLQRNSGLRR